MARSQGAHLHSDLVHLSLHTSIVLEITPIALCIPAHPNHGLDAVVWDGKTTDVKEAGPVGRSGKDTCLLYLQIERHRVRVLVMSITTPNLCGTHILRPELSD